MKVRVVVADDHGIVRDGIRLALEGGGDCDVVGEVEDGLAAVRVCAEAKPDLVVVDVKMPLLGGIAVTRQLAAMSPAPRVVALSGDADARTVRDMLAAGAAAYVLKTELLRELVKAVKTVMDGGVYLSPKVARHVVDLALGIGAPVPPAGARSLSPREQEVLRLVASGRSTKEIASQLDVSIKTVETYRRQLMDKLRIFSVAELTKYAVREGLVEL